MHTKSKLTDSFANYICSVIVEKTAKWTLPHQLPKNVAKLHAKKKLMKGGLNSEHRLCSLLVVHCTHGPAALQKVFFEKKRSILLCYHVDGSTLLFLMRIEEDMATERSLLWWHEKQSGKGCWAVNHTRKPCFARRPTQMHTLLFSQGPGGVVTQTLSSGNRIILGVI